MKYAYISVIERLSNNGPACDNRTTGCTVFLNCVMWLQSEILVEIKTKIAKFKYCIDMLFVLLICGIRNNSIDGLTSFTTTIDTTTSKTT